MLKRIFIGAIIMSFFGIVYPASAGLLEEMSKEDMVKAYVKGKVYSKYPGVTQIHLGKKAKGYGIAAGYSGLVAFSAIFTVAKIGYYNKQVNEMHDIAEKKYILNDAYSNHLISPTDYNNQFNILSDQYDACWDNILRNKDEAIIGLGICAVGIALFHIYDHFDSKGEFNKYYENNKGRFDFTLDNNKNIITAVRFNF